MVSRNSCSKERIEDIVQVNENQHSILRSMIIKYRISEVVVINISYFSDDEDDMDADEENIAVAASFGISAVFKSPSGKSSHSSGSSSSKSSNQSGQPFKDGNAGPSQQNVDKERLTVDISALKQQYSKLRQRQKQAHIILTCKIVLAIHIAFQ